MLDAKTNATLCADVVTWCYGRQGEHTREQTRWLSLRQSKIRAHARRAARVRNGRTVLQQDRPKLVLILVD
jgi:hypothetical protein